MPRPRVLPDTEELMRMVRAGRTHREIAAEYGVTRAAVTAHLRNLGVGRETIRYQHLLPWRVRQEHAKQYPARMLRYESRLRGGAPLSDDDRRKLESWKRTLRANDYVVVYMAACRCATCDGDGGFHYLTRDRAVQLGGDPAPGYEDELIYVSRRKAEQLNLLVA